MFVLSWEDLTPSQRGGIAELAVAWHAARAGIGVLRPVVEGVRYDLAFDTGSRLLRVQCKSAPLRGDTIHLPTRTSRHSPTAGYVRTTYDPLEVDLIAGYCPELDRVYVVPIADVRGQTMLSLRLNPAKNNQRSLVRWAAQYELGAIAQLEERLHGMQEVVGSSPTSSTPPKAA